MSNINNLGVDKCKAGDYDTGIAHFNDAIRKFPDEFEIKVLYTNRAIAFQDIGFPISATQDAAVVDIL